MPRLRHHLFPTLLLLPLVLICGKLLLTPVYRFGTDADRRLWRMDMSSEEIAEIGWPWPFSQSVWLFSRPPKRLSFSWLLLTADAILVVVVVYAAALVLQNHRRRRGAWLRFSLAELLSFVIALAVAIGWLANHRLQWRREQQAIGPLAGDTSVTFEYAYCGPQWLERLWPDVYCREVRTSSGSWTGLGENFGIFCRATECRLGPTSDDTFRRLSDALGELDHVKTLTISNIPMNQMFMALTIANPHSGHNSFRILDPSRFERIESLSFSRIDMDEELLAQLATLPNLSRLQVWGTLPAAPNRGLDHVARCSHLEELRILVDNVTDEELAALRPLSRLKLLQLTSTQLTDAAANVLENFKSLEDLYLGRCTSMTDGRIRSLIDQLPELKTFTPPDTLLPRAGERIKRRNLDEFLYERNLANFLFQPSENRR
jgi:hypothetical protein